ncbi:MAG: VOC family protein [Gammaproteobacteria bacterium]
MKRFHAHIAVTNLEDSINFYSKLFGQQPTKRQDNYAKWMLEDPRVNFAISSRAHAPGVNHFGFQVDSPDGLAALKQLAEAASPGQVLNQGKAACCYAESEKHWTIDPQGLAWEHFHTMSDALEFGDDTENQAGTCCIPMRSPEQDTPSARAACCIPKSSIGSTGACCG